MPFEAADVGTNPKVLLSGLDFAATKELAIIFPELVSSLVLASSEATAGGGA